jgi:hypothetical protein
MLNRNDEYCQDCIWWDGDNSGEQGECTNGVDKLITGRYENCVSFLPRQVEVDHIVFD